MRNVMLSDQLREDRMALENLLANLPQNKPGKSSSLEMTPYSTPQLSPATTPANKKNRLPIGEKVRKILGAGGERGFCIRRPAPWIGFL